MQKTPILGKNTNLHAQNPNTFLNYSTTFTLGDKQNSLGGRDFDALSNGATLMKVQRTEMVILGATLWKRK